MMTGAFDQIALRAQIAAVWEATARKPGNVHPGAAFADVEYTDFVIAAGLLGQVLATWSRGPNFVPSVGRAIMLGGGHSRYWVDSNTNLGIALLLVPLAVPNDTHHYRTDLVRVLERLTVEDARYVYEAIRIANPGGLGHAPEQDVRSEPTVTLLEAMRLAADRDMVARQYANGFADVFDFGVPTFLTAFERFGCIEAAIIDSQLRWLTEYPDSLIARKNGPAVAADVQRQAGEVLRLGGIVTPEGRRAGIALDRHLRSNGNKLNPGTTADLITACLFVALRENKVSPSAPFRWDVPDWL